MAVIIDPGPRPELAYLPVALLKVDHRYQRSVDNERSHAHIRRIAASFRWAAFQAILATPAPDGGWLVLDGQHRVEAASAWGASQRADAIAALINRWTPQRRAPASSSEVATGAHVAADRTMAPAPGASANTIVVPRAPVAAMPARSVPAPSAPAHHRPERNPSFAATPEMLGDPSDSVRFEQLVRRGATDINLARHFGLSIEEARVQRRIVAGGGQPTFGAR